MLLILSSDKTTKNVIGFKTIYRVKALKWLRLLKIGQTVPTIRTGKEIFRWYKNYKKYLINGRKKLDSVTARIQKCCEKYML